MDVFKHVFAIHDFLIILTSYVCPTKFLRRVLFSQHRVTLPAVRVLAAPEPLIDPRTLTSPQLPPSSYFQRIPQFCGARRQLALWVWLHVTDFISPTSSVSVAKSTPMMLAVSRPGPACCCHQHVVVIMSAVRLNSTWYVTFAHHTDGRAASEHRADQSRKPLLRVLHSVRLNTRSSR